jgi:electron transfer flavoprotein beta subunit
MKILVPIKRVVDYNVKIRVKSDNSAVETANVKMSMNPFDEIAVEEAVRMKESSIANDIVVVSIGSAKSEDIIRTALAMGADRGILVETSAETQPLNVAKILKKIVEQESPDLIIMGKQAIDDDYNQTGQMLSALLGWPQATFASKITVNGNKAEVMREVDAGIETVMVNLPAVITTDLRLNEPRYPALPNIMKARSKPMEKKTADHYGVDMTPRLKTLKVEEPAVRTGGIKVDSIEELVSKLKAEGVI